MGVITGRDLRSRRHRYALLDARRTSLWRHCTPRDSSSPATSLTTYTISRPRRSMTDSSWGRLLQRGILHPFRICRASLCAARRQTLWRSRCTSWPTASPTAWCTLRSGVGFGHDCVRPSQDDLKEKIGTRSRRNVLQFRASCQSEMSFSTRSRIELLSTWAWVLWHPAVFARGSPMTVPTLFPVWHSHFDTVWLFYVRLRFKSSRGVHTPRIVADIRYHVPRLRCATKCPL